MTTMTLSVPEISCGHCKQTIEGALADVAGVESAEVDVDAKTVAVVGGERDVIVSAIEDVGFDVEN